MNTRLKMTSLAALTAATLALPAAAQDMKDERLELLSEIAINVDAKLRTICV